MNKSTMRLLAMLICFTVLIGLLPMSVAADEEEAALVETVAEVTASETTEVTEAISEAAELVTETTESTEETVEVGIEATEVPTEETEAPEETVELVIEATTAETEVPEETVAAVTEATEVPVEETEVAELVEDNTIVEVSSQTETIEIDQIVEENADGELIVLDTVTTVQAASAGSTLPQLEAPTNLEWGYDHDKWVWNEEEQTGELTTVAMPGAISWQPSQLSQSMTQVCIYSIDDPEEPVRCVTWHFGSTDIPEWRTVDDFCMADMDSGTYYFTLTEIGDGINYSNSETVTSDNWTYNKPSAQLGVCSSLGWQEIEYEPGFATSFSGPADSSLLGGYEFDIYFAASTDEEPHIIGGIWSRYPDGMQTLPDDYIQENGNGLYYYQVRALSADITQARNGEWSEMSPAYNLGEVSETVEAELENIVADSESMTEDEIRDAVQSMDTAELKTAMLADENVVEDVAALEEKVGGAAEVEVTDDAADFDQSKISIVGANLNNAESAEEPIKLVIDKPEQEHVIDTAYDNSVSVQFSMNLENVEDTENLDVPVKITLPIPSSINPEFLVILHYHANGSVEELMVPDVYVYNEGEQYYASFVLTSFSDFVMTQHTTADDTDESIPVYRLYNPYTNEHLLTSGKEEKDSLLNAGWKLDGVAWNAPSEGASVYRLYNPFDDWHTYTMSQEEIDLLVPLGWTVDGIVTCSASDDGLPIYRLFNPYEQKNYHLLTANTAERDMLVNAGWLIDGVAWWAVN